MSKIIVVYHSGYGHTQRMAQAICRNPASPKLLLD